MDAALQKEAIASLQTYVTDSAYFLCLVAPHHKHEVDGSRRGFMEWHQRYH